MEKSLELTGKMHIPDDPGFYEKYYFSPGDLGYKNFDTSFGKIGTLICWDQWYPEAARLTALQGAAVLFYPTAIGWHPYEKEKHGRAQYESWLTVQRGHAIANGIYVAAVNRIGLEKVDDDSPGIEFWGQSFVCDPQGMIIAQASSDKEEILLAEIDTDRIEYIRHNWPFLRDRRIDSLWQDITKRFLDEIIINSLPEWTQHEATWIGWPYNKSDWPGKFSPIPYVYAEIVKYISRGEKVRIFVQSKEHKIKAEKVLKRL